MRKETNYDHCYQTLNLKPGASLSQIKHRYRELARRWHPDTVPPAQRDYATYQFQQINAAKDTLESYWEQHNSAPPSESRQHFEEAIQRRRTRRHYQTTSAWPSPSEASRQQSQHFSNIDSSNEIWRWQNRRVRRTTSHVNFLDRIFIVLVAEASIYVILWFGYHTLVDLHSSTVAMQPHGPQDLMFNVFFGLFVMALLIGGYLIGIALIILAFLFLFVPHEEILRLVSRRRNRPVNPFPNLSRSFPSRQK